MQTLDTIAARLMAWPRSYPADFRAAARQSLDGCRSLFLSPRAVLIYEDIEEPWINLADLSEEGFRWQEREPAELNTLFDSPLDSMTFAGRGEGLVTVGDVPDADVRVIARCVQDLGIDECLTFPLLGENVRGRVFVAVSSADPALAEIASLLTTAWMEGAAAVLAARAEAVREERFRVARDLHDGLLQSFTGVVLQLENVHALVEENRDEARRRITEIQASIMGDQRELRSYVEELRPRRVRTEVIFHLADRLEELRVRFREQWSVDVTFDCTALEAHVVGAIGQETFRIISEALTNSARHGSATQVEVVLGTAEGRIAIDVSDNGTGFSFQGRRSLESIRTEGGGPAMLAERVASLNGDLEIESTETGARLHISIPLGWTGHG